jgi:uncharacterized membrane protein YhaH (DUF805 family)
MTAILRRREIYVVIFTICSVVVILDKFFGEPHAVTVEVLKWDVSIIAFAIFYGCVAFTLYHLRRITRRMADWQWSIWMLLMMVITIALGVVDLTGTYQTLIYEIVTPLQISVLVFVGFYSYTIFYKASLGVRSAEVVVLLFCTIFGLLMNAPIGEAIWPGFPQIGTWLNRVPGVGGNNALLIGLALGAIGLYIRTTLGYERAYLGE